MAMKFQNIVIRLLKHADEFRIRLLPCALDSLGSNLHASGLTP